MEKARRFLLGLALVLLMAAVGAGVYLSQRGPSDPLEAAAVKLERKYGFLDVVGIIREDDYIAMLVVADITLAPEQAEQFLLDMYGALQGLKGGGEKWLVVVVLKDGYGIGELDCKANVEYTSQVDLDASCFATSYQERLAINPTHVMWPGR